jgi:hypothetical protein
MKFFSLLSTCILAVPALSNEAPTPSPLQAIPPVPNQMLPKYAMSCDWQAITLEAIEFPLPQEFGTSSWQAVYSCCRYAIDAAAGEAQEAWYSTKEACAEKCGCKGFYDKGGFDGDWIDGFCAPGDNDETKTTCTVNANGFACTNGGVLSGFVEDGNCACDCTNTGYVGDQCEDPNDGGDGRRLKKKPKTKKPKTKKPKSPSLDPDRFNGPPCAGLSDSAFDDCLASSPCFNQESGVARRECEDACKQQQQWAEYENSGVKFRKAKPKYEGPIPTGCGDFVEISCPENYECECGECYRILDDRRFLRRLC